jgi:hypothetical protein
MTASKWKMLGWTLGGGIVGLVGSLALGHYSGNT